MNARELLDELKRSHGLQRDSDVAEVLGLSTARISQMRQGNGQIGAKQVVSYLKKAEERGRQAVLEQPIKPIVEMYPINATSSRQDKKWEILPTTNSNTTNRSIRKYLEKSKGIYLFYDSLGRAIYVGKTVRLDFWREMNSAFNRERSNHMVTLVNHPMDNKPFLPAWEQPRQPTKCQAFLHDTAHYFSAYEVMTELIGDFEAPLVRSFANNLTNKRMEKFSSR